MLEAQRQAEIERQQQAEIQKLQQDAQARQEEARARQEQAAKLAAMEAERKRREEAQGSNFAASLDKLFDDEDDREPEKVIQDLSDIPEMKNTGIVQEPTMVPVPSPSKKADLDDDDYDDDDYDDDEEEGRGHPFLRFLITTLTVILAIQLVVFAMSKLWPEAGITQTAMAIAQSVQAAVDSFLANLIDKIVDIFHKG